MVTNEGAKEILLRIQKNCDLLSRGYPEKAEYRVMVSYHQTGCDNRGCSCPQVEEARTRTITRPSLLQQLREFAAHKDTDRNPKAERGAPRIKVAGRPPGDMAGFLTLDEIECDIPRVVDRVLEEVGRDRTWAAVSVLQILYGLAGQVGHFIESHPDQAKEIDKAAAGWVRSAKRALRVDAQDAMFEGVVCGNCGGGLATPWGNRGEAEVRCVGGLDEGPCGESYPMTEWINLASARVRGER